jgi:mRNA interferase MazF
MKRGEIWWADLEPPRGSEPGYRRPVLIVQSDKFNESNINTIICAAISSNLKLKEAPGNLLLTRAESGLDKDSVVNFSQILTIDRVFLTQFIGSVRGSTVNKMKNSLNIIFDLSW